VLPDVVVRRTPTSTSFESAATVLLDLDVRAAGGRASETQRFVAVEEGGIGGIEVEYDR
jgi:hypothetical protein